MATTPTQVRIDAEVKKEAMELFANLGLDMSGAINIFLHQCVLRGGLPFTIEMPQHTQKSFDVIKKSKRISADSDINGHTDIKEIKTLSDS